MLTFGIFLGALLFVIGLITYWLAPRVGPNPIFGVRIGYAFASREIWDRTNRAGGILIAATGVGMILLGFIMRLLPIADNLALGIVIGALLVALIGGMVWLGFYARRLAQGTEVEREIAPVKFRWRFLAPVLLTFALIVTVGAYFYPVLPADHIATHFDFEGRANDWMSRDSFMLFSIGMGVFLLLINSVVVLIATREPLITFGRWGAHWRMDPERGLLFTGIALGLGNLILAFVLFDIAWFALHGSHVIPIATFLWIVMLIIPILIGLFFVLARRSSQLVAN